MTSNSGYNFTLGMTESKHKDIIDIEELASSSGDEKPKFPINQTAEFVINDDLQEEIILNPKDEDSLKQSHLKSSPKEPKNQEEEESQEKIINKQDSSINKEIEEELLKQDQEREQNSNLQDIQVGLTNQNNENIQEIKIPDQQNEVNKIQQLQEKEMDQISQIQYIEEEKQQIIEEKTDEKIYKSDNQTQGIRASKNQSIHEKTIDLEIEDDFKQVPIEGQNTSDVLKQTDDEVKVEKPNQQKQQTQQEVIIDDDPVETVKPQEQLVEQSSQDMQNNQQESGCTVTVAQTKPADIDQEDLIFLSSVKKTLAQQKSQDISGEKKEEAVDTNKKKPTRQQVLLVEDEEEQVQEEEEDVSLVGITKKPEKGVWIELKGMAEAKSAVVPKFCGIPNVKVNASKVKDLFKFYNGEKIIQGTLNILNEKSPSKPIKEDDYFMYIGMKILMGFMRLNTLKDYFLRPSWLVGNHIRNILPFEAFEFIDQHIEFSNLTLIRSSHVKQEYDDFMSQNDEPMHLVIKKLNKRFTNAFSPSQELILYKNHALTAYTNKISYYQLIDRKCGYILSQFFWNNQDLNNAQLQLRFEKMLQPFTNLNHIVYASPGTIDANNVIQLSTRRTHICTIVDPHPLLPKIDNNQSRLFVQNKTLYLLSNNAQWLTFATHSQLINRHPYLTEIASTLLQNEKFFITPSNNNQNHILFTFIIESIIHNIGAINQVEDIKKFRIELSSKIIPFSEDQQKSWSKQVDSQLLLAEKIKNKISVTVYVQTEEPSTVRFEKLLHCPVIDGNARCLVCLHEGQLSKTYSSCLGCSEAMNHKIFLCIYPCFRLFHLHPKKYLTEMETCKLVEGYYDEDEEEEELGIKPDTSNLERIYEKQNLQEGDYGIPINYEDDFRHRTNRRGQRTMRGQPQKKAGGGVGRGRKKVSFNIPGDGQGGDQNGENGKKRGRKPGQEEHEGEGEDADQRNAMLDFFSMVRKKVMTNNNK